MIKIYFKKTHTQKSQSTCASLLLLSLLSWDYAWRYDLYPRKDSSETGEYLSPWWHCQAAQSIVAESVLGPPASGQLIVGKKKKMKANKTLLFKSCFLAVLLLLTESVLPDKLHSELAVAFAHLWDHAVYTHLLQSFGQCSELLMSVHEYLCEAHKLSPCSYFPVRQRGRHGLLYWAWRDWILSRLLSIKLVKK